MIEFLEKEHIFYRTDVPISTMTTFRIGGPAGLVIYPENEKQAAGLIRQLVKEKKKYMIVGNGSNLLFDDAAFHTPIIKTDRLLRQEKDGDRFIFGAGVKLAAAAGFAADHGYTGMEFAQGIPGSIGGAVYMNAGAYDGTFGNIVVKTKYIDATGKICETTQHDFSYRHTVFMDTDCLILETTVHLLPGDPREIRAKMEDFAERRRSKQPLNYPSAGSFFKRPSGAFAGQLIEQCGLKGKQIGGAAISEKHAGFIINKDHASFKDVITLAESVQKIVKEQTGFTLECEVKIIR